MNIFQRIGAALTRQIEHENKVTSLNTAEPVESEEQKGRRIASYYGVELPVMTVKAEPDWEAIAEELMGALYAAHKCEYRDGGAACLACAAITRYEAAKQVKP
jgi:hypothetical protein